MGYSTDRDARLIKKNLSSKSPLRTASFVIPQIEEGEIQHEVSVMIDYYDTAATVSYEGLVSYVSIEEAMKAEEKYRTEEKEANALAESLGLGQFIFANRYHRRYKQ